jgi:gluconolactonase
MKLIILLIILSLVCICVAFPQKIGLDKIIRPGEKIEKLADGFLFTEGPASNAKGNVYFH